MFTLNDGLNCIELYGINFRLIFRHNALFFIDVAAVQGIDEWRFVDDAVDAISVKYGK